jgi:hypothetical protein
LYKSHLEDIESVREGDAFIRIQNAGPDDDITRDATDVLNDIQRGIWKQNSEWTEKKLAEVGLDSDPLRNIVSENELAEKIGLVTITQPHREHFNAFEAIVLKFGRDEIKTISEAHSNASVKPLTDSQKTMSIRVVKQFYDNAVKSLQTICEIKKLLDGKDTTDFEKNMRDCVLNHLEDRITPEYPLHQWRIGSTSGCTIL